MALFTPSSNFHRFMDLPFELRRQVWTIGLAAQLDRLYQVILEESDEDEAPYLCLLMRPEKFAQATTLTRRFLATCRESRQVTIELLPDTLQVRSRSRRSQNKDQNPTCLLRFSGTRDHIEILAPANGIRLQSSMNNGPHERFSGIKHMSLGLDGFGLLTRMFRQTNVRCPGRCEGPECAEACQQDPIPRFLGMFPDLSAVYILGPALGSPDSCSCVSEDGTSVGHDWPTLKTSNPRWSYYVIHREGVCKDFVLPAEVRVLRGIYPNWPHYRGLPHISFLYLRPVQARLEQSLRRRLSIGSRPTVDSAMEL